MRMISLDETDIAFQEFCEQYEPDPPRRPRPNPSDAAISKLIADVKGDNGRKAQFLGCYKLREILEEHEECKKAQHVPGELEIIYDEKRR